MRGSAAGSGMMRLHCRAACRGRTLPAAHPLPQAGAGFPGLGVREGGVRPIPVRHADRGGDQAAVPWRAQTSVTDGCKKDLAEISLPRFGADGLVVKDRDFRTQG
jgi:hypothetical protein